jgi:hypothetical protein
MKITLCASIAFIDEMAKIKTELKKMGHEIKMPPLEISNKDGKMISVKEYYAIRKAATDSETWVWQEKERRIRGHFDKIAWSDAILVLNYDKNNVSGYIGGNTFLEIGIAFYLGKKIFLLNQIPDMPYKEEILAMMPVVINDDLTLIK